MKVAAALLVVLAIALSAEEPAPAGDDWADKVLKTHAPDTVLARIGDTTITLRKFLDRIAKIPARYRNRLAQPTSRKEFLDRLVLDDLYYKEALALGLDKDPEYIEQMEGIRRNVLASRLKIRILGQEAAPARDDEAGNKAVAALNERLKKKYNPEVNDAILETAP